jgi:uncharacterized RDD family membrane protein YckC
VIDSLFINWPQLIATVVLITTLEEHWSRVEGEWLSWWFPSATGVVALVLGYLLSVALSLWNRTFRQGRTGQTIGKQALGIRLVADPTAGPFGQPPATSGPALAPIGPLNAFLRDLVHTIDGFAYVGYLWPLWDAKRQTFADKIMKTVVVDAR